MLKCLASTIRSTKRCRMRSVWALSAAGEKWWGIKNARAPLAASSTNFERQTSFKLAGGQKADWSSLAHSALPNSHRLAPTLIDFDAGPLRANAMANEPWVTAGQVAQR